MILSILLVSSVTLIAQSESELKQQITQLNKEMGDAMIAGDQERLMKLYTQDVISLPNNDKMTTGIDALRKTTEENLKSGWKVKDFNADIVSVEPNGDIITEVGTYTISLLKDGAASPVQREGKYLTLWEKQNDGSLKIKAEIWNYNTNPMQDMMSEGDGMMKDNMEMEKENKHKMKEGKEMMDKTQKDKTASDRDYQNEDMDDNK